MLPEFVNAIITLDLTGSYELYSGRTEQGGQTTVIIESKKAEGYNSQYFKIKQVVIEPGQQAYIQKFDVPSLEIAHKLILMSIEEGYHDPTRTSYTTLNEGVEGTNSKDQRNSINPTIPVIHQKLRPVNKIISETPIPANSKQNYSPDAFSGSEYPGGIDEDLESFMGSGIKIANMRSVAPSSNGQAANNHRSSIEGLLGSDF